MYKKLFFLLFLFALNFAKFISAGTLYRPLQDDYIQYWAYSHYPNLYEDVIKRIGILNVRPLAGICDIFIWSRFWGNMFIALIIITVLHFLSAYLFYSAFQKIGLSVGVLFFVIYLLHPLGFEAVYWISASSRIVVSMFFISVAVWALAHYLAKPDRHYFGLFTFSNFLGLCFYEQTATVGSACVAYIIVCNMVKTRSFSNCTKYPMQKKNLLVASCLISWAIIGIYYIIFSKTGSLGSRSASFTTKITLSQIMCTAKAIGRTWESGNILFYQGLKENRFHILFTVLCTILGISSTFFTVDKTYKIRYKFCMGVFLFLVSYVVHILIKAEYIPYRCTFASLIGLGLIADCAGDVLLKNNFVKFAAVFFIAFLFASANCYQADCYRKIHEADAAICAQIASQLNETAQRQEIAIHHLKELYIDVPEKYEQYILKNVTSSDWALTGAVRETTKDLKIKKIIPVYD
ncbi:MAG: hypothetical protein N2171_01255 [Clostridia bacterium]|nr:hypothetical protein [Clostridia bacterium]